MMLARALRRAHRAVRVCDAITRRPSSNDAVSSLLVAIHSTTDGNQGQENGNRSMQHVVDDLRRQMNDAMAVRRSNEEGNLIPKTIAEEMTRQYSLRCHNTECKMAFFTLMMEMGAHSHEVVMKNCESVLLAKDKGSEAICRAETRLRNSLIPIHQRLFVEFGKLENGVEFLTIMRKDFLELKSKGLFSASLPQVKLFDETLKSNLAQWFSAGFLELQRITWKSPASLLEKIAENERVHKVSGLLDVKQRVGPMRRCFTYMHNLLPAQPLVILHIALSSKLESRIEDIINDDDVLIIENDENVFAATFYSISSTNQGLAGIDLGNLLIKTAVEKLKQDFKHINTFGTLSPIPLFRKWLTTKLASVTSDCDNESLPTVLQHIDVSQIEEIYHCPSYAACLGKMKEILDDGTWVSKQRLADLIETPMTQLCARYLCEEKRRSSALDPVANFHLSNGALVWRINWVANTSADGMDTSYGLMVNYKYVLDDIMTNNHNYIVNSQVTMSEAVSELLERPLEM